MAPFIGIGNRVGERPINWPAYWAGLISATVEDAELFKVVLTFSQTNTTLTADDFYIEDHKTRSLSRDATNKIITLTIVESIFYGETPIIIFNKGTSLSHSITNNVLQVPKYTNDLGSGDRTASIVISTTISVRGGAVTALIDGTQDDTYHNHLQTVADKYFRFDFGVQKYINEAFFYTNDGAQSFGVWNWQGSNDAENWTNIGGNFTLQGYTTGTLQQTLSVNTERYRYYQMLGISGSTTTYTYFREIRFQIADYYKPPVVRVPLFCFIWDSTRDANMEISSWFDLYDFKATFAVSPGAIGNPDTVTDAELIDIESRGHEIASHGWTQTDLTLIPIEDAIAQMVDSRNYLENLGFYVNALIYSYGATNAAVMAEAILRYDASYNTVYTIQAFPASIKEQLVNRASLARMTCDGKTLITLKGYVDEIMTADNFKNNIYFLYAHAQQYDTEETRQIMKDFLAYVNSLGLTILRQKDVIEKLKTYFAPVVIN